MNFIIPVVVLTSLLCISVAEGYNFTSLGCWRDKGNANNPNKPRAIDSLEGTSDLLDGGFRRRENATEKCAELAYSLNFTIFAVSRGGECLGSENASMTWDFYMYGEEENCLNGKGGVKPRSMDVYYIEAGFDYDQCPDLEYDCHGDCCDQYLEGQQRCPGWYNPDTWCQESPDYCMPSTYNTTYIYAPSLGAAEVCNLECPPQCGYNDMTCYGKYWDGCDYSFCMPMYDYNQTYGDDYPYARQWSDYGNYDGNYGNDSCPMTCPTACSEFDIACPIGWDENGCSWGEYCMPQMYPMGDLECPGFCATICDWYNGEIACPIFSEDGCYIGNTCESGDDNGTCDSGMGMRMDENDHMMLRSGSPQGIQNFYNKLRF